MTKENQKELLAFAFHQKDAIKKALEEKQTFEVKCHRGSQSDAVTWLEKQIEMRGMSCRIYSSKRASVLAAGLIPSGFTQVTAAIAGVAIGIHNLATLNPDYEISKDLIDSNLTVIYKKDLEGEEVGDVSSDEKATSVIKIQELEKRLQKSVNALEGVDAYFKGVLALEAVAVAVANCDGNICEIEQQTIDEFIRGLNSKNFPELYIKRAQDLRDSPPSVREAYSLACDSGLEMSLFEAVIEVVVHADGHVHKNEQAFISAWAELGQVA